MATALLEWQMVIHGVKHARQQASHALHAAAEAIQRHFLRNLLSRSAFGNCLEFVQRVRSFRIRSHESLLEMAIPS